jgi:prepilin-type processing-associated H-X9-DG protein
MMDIISPTSGYISYGYNYQALGYNSYNSLNFWGQTLSYPVKITQIKQVSEQLTHLDTWFSNTTMQYRGGGSSEATQTKIAFRHGKRANTLYADGHVKAEDSKKLWASDQRYRPWNIWWMKNKAFTPRNTASWEDTYGYAPYSN